MSHVEARSVRLLCRTARDGARFPVELAVKIISEAAGALHAKHALGLVHGQLRPDRILVSLRGEVTVVDPGTVNPMKIWPHYMSPEQLSGQELDRRADVFALAVILYELLTGNRPFDAPDEVGVIQSVVKNTPQSPRMLRPDVDDELEAILSRAMVKDPVRRTPDCEALRSQLERYLGARGLSPTVRDLAIAMEAVETNAGGLASTPTDKPSADDVRRALTALADGLPGRNDPDPTGTGALDNAELRHLLAGAAFTVLLGSDPGDAFDALARHFEDRELVGWFGKTRAELILELLLYQTGWTEYSTWNSLRERALRRLYTDPDRRWMDVCRRVHSDSPRLMLLAAALREATDPTEDWST
jgi:hypothetical protein